jgi:hypothetical protein
MDSTIQEDNEKLFIGNESKEIIGGKNVERGEIGEECEEMPGNIEEEDLVRQIIGKIAKEKRQRTEANSLDESQIGEKIIKYILKFSTKFQHKTFTLTILILEMASKI